MTALRIGFLFRRPYGAGHVSIFPKTMQALADAGVVVDVIAANGRLIDLSTVRRGPRCPPRTSFRNPIC